MFAKFFNEYEIGETWTSKGRTITESDIVMFAGLSGDWFSLHTDQEYAATTQYKKRVAHGMLTLSVSSGLWILHPDVVVAFYGIDKLRFIRPTFIGDTLHIELEVIKLVEKPNGNGLVIVEQKMCKQTGEIVSIAEISMLIKKS
ncbi:MAG: MaoC/PaaZ C-terminal domain-containing protein [Bacillus sp. (in: firmicutes)]